MNNKRKKKLKKKKDGFSSDDTAEHKSIGSILSMTSSGSGHSSRVILLHF
jgi:hypothetical protein